jgi:hypothetical protein
MNSFSKIDPVEMVVIGLEPGDLLLESIRKAIADHDIANGVIVSGIGTLKTCAMHYITHRDFPPRDRTFVLEKPLELVSLSGIIAERVVHPHIVVSCMDEETWGGHLEEGSEILYLGEVAILKFASLAMKRVPGRDGIKFLRQA